MCNSFRRHFHSSFFLFVQSRLVLFHRFGSVVNTLGFQDTWLQYSTNDKCRLEVSYDENCSSCFLSYIKLFTLYLDKLKRASDTHVTNPRPGQYLPTVNARISARGAYSYFLRREGGANLKGGAYLKGALISFINFWPQNDNIKIQKTYRKLLFANSKRS